MQLVSLLLGLVTVVGTATLLSTTQKRNRHPAQETSTSTAVGSVHKLTQRAQEWKRSVLKASRDHHNLHIVHEKLSWLRAKSNSNSLRHDGKTSTTAESRQLFREHVPPLLDILSEMGDMTASPAVALAYTETTAYHIIGQGLVGALRSGTITNYMNSVETLVTKFPTYDGGAGYVCRGAYLMSAPWPIGSPAKAAAAFRQAVAIEPRSKTNLYYLAMATLASGDHELAADLFDRTASMPCLSGKEKAMGAFLNQEAARGAQAARKKMGRKHEKKVKT